MQKNYIEQLRGILNITGFSQSMLAKELGVTFAALNRWINKKAKPRPSAQKMIRDLYREKVGSLPLPKEVVKKTLGELARKIPVNYDLLSNAAAQTEKKHPPHQR